MPSTKHVARITGLAYLGLAISGLLASFLLSQVYAPGDALKNAANLVAHEGLARLCLAAEVGMVLTQAITAVYFWSLFRPVHRIAAGSIAAFGMVNAVVILVGTACSAKALEVALGGGAESASQALLLSELNETITDLGCLFFGLWLLPMGWLAARSGYMPRVLGWLLIAGGIGYVLSVFVLVIGPGFGGGAGTVAFALSVPATTGELWMVGYLLVRGVADRTGGDRLPPKPLSPALG